MKEKDIFFILRQHRQLKIFGTLFLFCVFCYLLLHFFTHAFIPSLAKIYPDFPNYFIPAKVFINGEETANIYDPIWFQHKMSQYGVDTEIGSPWFFPPFTSIIFLPLAYLDIFNAKLLWNTANLFILFLTIFLLRKWTSLNILSIAVLVLLSGIPLEKNFILGHFYLLLLALILLSFSYYRRGANFHSGFIIAFCAAVKLSPVFFIIYFLIKRRWKAFFSSGAFFVLFLITGFFYLGKQANLYYWLHIFPRIANDIHHVPFSIWNQSVFCMLQKAFLFSESLNPHPFFYQPLIYEWLKSFFVVFPLFTCLAFILHAKHGGTKEKAPLELAMIVLTILLVSGFTTYHFTLLILPAIILFDASLKRKNYFLAFLIVCAYIFCGTNLMAKFYLHPAIKFYPLRFPRLWILCFFFITSLIYYATLTRVRCIAFYRALAVTAVAASALCLPYLANQKSCKKDNAHLAVKKNYLVSYAPSVRDDIILFSGVKKWTDGKFSLFSNNGFSTRNSPFHAFSPDISPDGKRVIFELLKDGKAQIGELNTENNISVLTPQEQTCQYPVYSPDGGYFFYSCRVQGAMDIFRQSFPENSSKKQNITLSPYNEIEPDISPDGKYLAFSSDKTGVFKIFLLELSSLRKQQITSGTSEDTNPKWSPDGNWIAFSSFRNGNRDIWIINPWNKKLLRITKHIANDADPCWASDGRFIYFSSDRERGIFAPAIYKIRPESE